MPTPAVFPALAVIAGIAAGVFAPSLKDPAIVALVSSGLCSVVAWQTHRGRIFLASLLLGFVSAGFVLGSARMTAAARSPLREFFNRARAGVARELPPIALEGLIREDAAPTEYGASMTVDVIRVQTSCGWLPAPGGLRVAIVGLLARGRLDEWRAGRRVRLPVLLRVPEAFRDPGVADDGFGMVRRGIVLAGSTKSAALVEVLEHGHALAELAAAARAYARRVIAVSIPDRPVASGIVTAILVGDRGGLDTAVERRLQEAGTYHVIAISGGNVAILAGIVFVLLRAVRVPMRAGSILLACLVCAYGYVAGGGASVARATVAAAVYLVATAADHRSPALNVLGTVALLAVTYEPLAVFDPGLLLSYGATLALLTGADRVLRRGGSRNAETRGDAQDNSNGLATVVSTPDRTDTAEHIRGPRRLILRASARLGVSASSASQHLSVAGRAIFLGTLSAEMAILPIAAFIFHRVTLAGIVLNLVAIPLMTVAQVAGIGILLLWPVSPTLARAAGIVAGIAADGLPQSTSILVFAPWLTWRVPSPPLTLMAAYYVGWALVLLQPRRQLLRRAGAAASACAALSIAFPALVDGLLIRRSPGPGELRVTFLDVGQGDSIVLQFPTGTTMLVDAAGVAGSSFDTGDRVITPAMLALGVRRLDYLVITHGDPDHVEGAVSVARDFPPRELWEGVIVPPHETLRVLRAQVTQTRGAVRLVRPDDRLAVGPVEVRVLHPPEPDWERQRVRNDDSIVLELHYGDLSIILPGDIGAAVEESLAPKVSAAPIRILKAAHHGSATSTGDTWLRAARPAAVIFSCGRDNRYSHPAPVVLGRVNALGAAVFRTDQDGAITVTTDGHSARVTTFMGRTSVLPRTTVMPDHKGH